MYLPPKEYCPMNSVYRLRSDELTLEFITILKKSYPHKEIEITVDEVVDETEYLMSTTANRVHLENAIRNIEQHTNLVSVPVETLIP
jgi:translation initiation factor 2B subunit (eIF-2B alpha/beta/delta family)